MTPEAWNCHSDTHLVGCASTRPLEHQRKKTLLRLSSLFGTQSIRRYRAKITLDDPVFPERKHLRYIEHRVIPEYIPRLGSV